MLPTYGTTARNGRPVTAHILVIEGESSVVDDIATTLQQTGYRVPAVVATGAAAIEAAETAAPDLALVDIVLPGEVDGIEVATQLWTQLDIPIVYVTEDADQEIRSRAQAAEPFGYLVKPVQEHELLATIDVALNQHRARRQERERAHRKDEARLRRLLDSMQEGFALHEVICNAEGKPVDYRFLEVNPAFEAITGLAADDILGQTAREALPTLEPYWIETYGEVALTGESVQFEHYSGPLDKHFAVTAFSPVRGQFATTFTDITVQKRATERAEALARVAGRLNALHDLNAILQAVCEETSTALDVPAATVALYDEETDRLQHTAEVGMPAAYRERVQPMPVPDALYDEGQRVRPVIATLDAQALPEGPNFELYRDLTIRSVAGASLARSDDFFGLLTAYTFDESRRFSEDELTLLRGVADQTSQAIANARLFEDAERRLRQVRALRKIDTAITGSLDLNLTLEVFLDQVMQQLQVDAAAVLLAEPHTRILEYAAGQGFHTPDIERTRQRIGEGHAGRTALERSPVGIDNLATSSASFLRADMLKQESFAAYHAAPLIAKGEIQGVLETFHRAPFAPDPEWIDFLETLAGQAAIAIHSVKLFDDLQQSNSRLAASYDATIEGWAKALEMRDDETEGHTRRVTEMTTRLARALGISTERLPHIRRGAMLHDIGKIAIPDSILLKPGPLDDDEWAVMRQHPQYAVDLLSPVKFLRPALDIPEFHHERWDGSGYPCGLKGRQIPIAARIFAVVDVWDALRSDRPYREAWPEDKVRAYLREQAGIQFDSEVTGVFLKVLDEH